MTWKWKQKGSMGKYQPTGRKLVFIFCLYVRKSETEACLSELNPGIQPNFSDNRTYGTSDLNSSSLVKRSYFSKYPWFSISNCVWILATLTYDLQSNNKQLSWGTMLGKCYSGVPHRPSDVFDFLLFLERYFDPKYTVWWQVCVCGDANANRTRPLM